MKKKRSLASKFIMGFVVVGIVLCVIAVSFSYSGFVQSMEQQYHDSAYYIADTAESLIFNNVSLEELESFVEAAKSGDKEKMEAAKNSQAYQNVSKALSQLRSNMDLTDIYVTYYDPVLIRKYAAGDDSIKPLLYVFDNYYKAEENFAIGDTSKMNKQNVELFAEVIDNKTTQSKFIISDGEFGYNISALKPVLSKDGKEVICVIAVEEPMRRVQSAARDFVIRTVGLLVIAIILIIVFFVIYLYRRVVKPIDVISKEVKRFGETNDRNEQSEATLNSIKTDDEVEELAIAIDKMEADMLKYVDNITAITAEKERIGAELNVATQIQADMLPSIFPAFPERKEIDIYATMDPAKEVGGDFYDFFMIDDKRLGLVMADVSGKGVPAALFMVIAKTLIKNKALIGGTPSEVLSYANEQLCEGNKAELFVTVWFAIIDLTTGKGMAANAGHEHPVLKRAGGEYELIQYRHSPAVATMEGMKFKEHEFELFPGDRLFVYTDGVAEATSSQNELYGYERMLKALNSDKDASLPNMLKNLREDIDAFVGEAPQFDDITMMVLDYFGAEGK